MDFLKRIFNKKEGKIKHSKGKDSGIFLAPRGERGVLICGGDSEIREEAAAILGEKLQEISSGDINGEIRRIFDLLNSSIRKRGAELSGMAYCILEKHVVIGHVGMARAYIVRDNEIIQLTEDDTQGWILFKSGIFTEERLKESPLGTMLTKGIGKEEGIRINISEYYYSEGEKLLLVDGCQAMKTGEDSLYNRFSGPVDKTDMDYLRGQYLIKEF